MAVDKEVASSKFLDSIEGEISFFRSLMRARPVGVHRHFHVLAMQSSILKETGRLVRTDDLWAKLKGCYDTDALEAIDMEAEGYENVGPNNSNTISTRSPSPSANLSGHPFFRDEFTLPFDEFEPLMSQRRMRASASVLSSSPAPSPAIGGRAHGGRKRGKSKLDMAGLVGGDSDSSALTQESGDEGVAETSRESVVTGTDVGTDYAEEEDIEMHGPSPAPSASPKPTRNRAKFSKKVVPGGRTRTRTSSTTSRGTKKRKR